jgi:hypothetical protein
MCLPTPLDYLPLELVLDTIGEMIVVSPGGMKFLILMEYT